MGFVQPLNTTEVIAKEADIMLFTRMAHDQHCLHALMPIQIIQLSP